MNVPEDMDHPLEAKVRDLERRLAAVERTDRLIASSIDAGGLTIKGGFIRWLDDAGNETARFATDGLTLAEVLDVLGTLNVTGAIDLEGTLTVDGDIEVSASGTAQTANFDGDLDGDDPGTTGWAMDGSGTAAFNTLLLGDQIISPDALRQMFRRASGSASNFFPGTGGTTANANVAVPDWATAAEVDVWAAATLTNTTGADESIIIDITIDGDHEISHRVTVPAGADGHVTGFTFAQLFETFGQLGDTIACSATVRTAANSWGQTATNLVQIHAVADLFD